MNRRLFTAAFAALLFAGIGTPAVLAHDTDCPVCKLKVVQDTAEQDNEVALRYGRKRIEYRCVWCALSDSAQYQGDLKLLAPSETKAKPVLLERVNGKWIAPDGAVFVGVKNGHETCPITYRAFSTRAAFDTYVARHKDTLKDAKPLTLVQMLALANVTPKS